MSLPRKILPWLILLSASPSLYAANPCIDGGALQPRDGSGIGGTGHLPSIMGSSDGSGTGGTGHGPVQEDGSGTGGTGHAPWVEAHDGHGMGGTGNIPPQDGNGMGGTGHDTEVEGVITGFASICVNGLELHYQSTTPVAINGRAGSPKDLAIGQVVRAQATGNGDQLSLRGVQVRHLLVGTLQGLDGKHLQALGQNIALDEAAVLPNKLAAGTRVAVSGFIGPRGRLVATRVDAVSADTPDSITGEAGQNSQGRTTIGGVALDIHDNNLKPGDMARAEGRFEQGQIRGARVNPDEHSRNARQMIIQGPVQESGGSGLTVGGQRFTVDQATRMQHGLPETGQWVRVDGARDGDAFRARSIEIQERPLPLRRESGSPGGQRARNERESEEHEEHEEHEEYEGHGENRESGERNERGKRSERYERGERRERRD